LAADYGGSLKGRVFCEAGSSVTALWSMLVALDECSGGRMVEQLREFAARGGVDLTRLLATPPPTSAFLQLLDALSRWGGECVIAPSPDHFDGNGVPRKVLLELIARADPVVSVEYLTPLPIPRAMRLDRSEDHLITGNKDWDEDRPVELGCEQFHAYGLASEIVGLSNHRHLSRAGLGDLVDHVHALLAETVCQAIRFTARENLPPAANQLTVRWLRYPNRLLVTVEETREHHDEPISIALERLCGLRRGASVGRDQREGGGTVTWFDLPLPLYCPPGRNPWAQATGLANGGRS
ncbi:hypothetical protein, partial [Nocardia sp. XZ_19_369]|uniref:hypothetical protein n=1 Tax=Nocardia sp. XZ_19_369 TaxID=2769487 RepID=UPI00188F2C2C